MKKMDDRIKFAQVLRDLMDAQYKRNRGTLAKRVHMSPSALSQYTAGRATPTLESLALLADALGVSLDYLVFGRESTPRTPEVGFLAGHLELAIRDAETRGAGIYDLVSRTGAMLGDKILATVREIQAEQTALGGVLTPEEVSVVEACSRHTTIVTTVLDTEVLLLRSDSDQQQNAPGQFMEALTRNLDAGYRYDYVIPADPALDAPASALLESARRHSRKDAASLRENLRIFRVATSCVPGFVLYELFPGMLRRYDASLADRIDTFLHRDPDDDNIAHCATIEPASRSHQTYALLESERVARLFDEVTRRRANHFDGALHLV